MYFKTIGTIGTIGIIGIMAPLLVGCGEEGQDLTSDESGLQTDEAKFRAEGRKRAMAKLDRMLDHIDATTPQRARAKQMAAELIKDGAKLRDSHRETHKKLMAQWASATPDRKAVHRTVDQQLDQLRPFVHKVLDRIIDLHGVLTVEQRATILVRAEQLHALKMKAHRRGCWFKRTFNSGN